MSKPTIRKRSEQVERRYIVDVLNQNYPHAQQIMYNFPITPIDPAFRRQFPGVSDNYFTRFRRYVDAIVVTDDELMLVEAKIRRPIDGLGQLLLYRHYVTSSKELKPFLNRRIVPTLISPKHDPYLIPVAQSNGFRYVIAETEHSIKYLKDKGFV